MSSQGSVSYEISYSIKAKNTYIIAVSHPVADGGYTGKNLGNLCLINKIQPFGKIRLAALHSEHYKHKS